MQLAFCIWDKSSATLPSSIIQSWILFHTLYKLCYTYVVLNSFFKFLSLFLPFNQILSIKVYWESLLWCPLENSVVYFCYFGLLHLMVTGGVTFPIRQVHWTNCSHNDNNRLKFKITGTTCRLYELVVWSYVKGLVGNALLFACPYSCEGFSFRALANNCTVCEFCY